MLFNNMPFHLTKTIFIVIIYYSVIRKKEILAAEKFFWNITRNFFFDTYFILF